jgi:recombination protein RecT
MANNQLQTIKHGLMHKGTVKVFHDALPTATGDQAGKAAERFAKMVYTTIVNNPSLQKCSVPSLIKAASQSASLGLDLDARGLAYLVPYGSEANFQIGYLGLIELAYRSGKVKAISAHCIYESEKDRVSITRVDGKFEVKHPFSYEPPKGKIIAVYATAEVEGFGSFTDVMRADEIERIRSLSKAKNSPAWKDHYEAMAKKTVIRRLAKFLPKSIVEDFARAVSEDEANEFGYAKKAAEATVEAETATEVVEDTVFEEEQQGNNEAETMYDWVEEGEADK